jgi:hypothetical protein
MNLSVNKPCLIWSSDAKLCTVLPKIIAFWHTRRAVDITASHCAVAVCHNGQFYGGAGGRGECRTLKIRAKDTRAIQKFNRACTQWKNFFTTILLLRDGLAVTVKA